MRTVHRTRRWSFKGNSFTIVTTAMTRTLEFVFTGFPVRRATQMRASRIDDKQAIGSLRDPDAILLLPLGIDTKCVISGHADAKYIGWFEN